jgi:hypothetical protein
MRTRRDLLRKAGGGAAALTAGPALAAVTMPPAHAEPDPLIELAERFAALQRQSDAAVAKIDAARAAMEEAGGFRPWEPMGFVALPTTPRKSDPGYVSSPEEIEAIYGPALASGGPDVSRWEELRDSALRHLAAVREAKDRHGVTAAEIAANAADDLLGKAWAQIVDTPARTPAGLLAKLRAVLLSVGGDDALDRTTIAGEFAASVLADVARVTSMTEARS